MLLITILLFLFIFGLIALIVPIQHVANLRTIKMMAKIPGPKGLPFIGVGYQISTLESSDILDYLSNLCKEFPRLFKLWTAGIPFVILQEPEDLEVAMGSIAHIEKGLEYNPLLPWLQEGLLVSKDTAMGVNLNAQQNQGKEYVEAVKRSKEINIEDDGLGKKKIAFLDSMIEMDLKYPNSFTDSDIREEVDTFMFEGHDTTSAALTFAMYLLGHHQEIQEKAYQEQFDIFGYSDREVSLRDLQNMNYLDKIIKETLRLYPSVPYISRMLTQDMKLEGITIPKGVNIIMIPYLVHRNPKHFSNPEAFDPERFSSDLSSKRHPYAYIPFSAGPRNCQKFATMELKVVISTLLRFTKMETVTKPEDFNLTPLLVLRTDKPIIVRVKKRAENC